MSDNIPFDIQIEIMQRLPVVSLVRFRSVSKQWKSLIENSEFINDHTRINRNRSQHHLLVRHGLSCEQYTSIIDNDTFPSQKSSLTVPPPISSLDSYDPSVLVNSVNGLSCFYGCKYLGKAGKLTKMAVLWNPIIRKYVGIAIPNFYYDIVIIGFGFCHDTSDPKLVKVNKYFKKSEVMVFTLSSRVWKSVSNVPPALGACRLEWNQVCIKGCIHWWAKDRSSGEVGETNVIVSFDLESEKFGLVRLPECLLKKHSWKVAEVNELLGVLVVESDYYDKDDIYVMWMMEFVTKSFTKMFTVKLPVPHISVFGVLGFRKNGEFIIEVDDGRKKSRLDVYEPSSGRINHVWINGKSYKQCVSLYMETLLLLDQTSSIIQFHDDDVGRYGITLKVV